MRTLLLAPHSWLHRLKAQIVAWLIALSSAPGAWSAGGPAKPVAAQTATHSARSGARSNTATAENPTASPSFPPPPQSEPLKGRVSAEQSPFLTGSLQTVPPGTRVTLTLTGNLNSEVNQKGDEVFARIAMDVRNGEKVLMPGGWYVHGIVTDIAAQKRLGRDGWVEVEFDTLVSPDGNYELPFKAKLSTRDNQIKAVVKTAAVDAAYLSAGAAAGALLSAQLTGIPIAIMTQGYSLAIGAGVGAGIGAVGAMKRKGKIASFYPGDELKLTIAEPLSLPGFDPQLIASASRVKTVPGVTLKVLSARFARDPYGDNRSRLLTLELEFANGSDKEYSLFDLAVACDHNQRYYPSLLSGLSVWKKHIGPHSTERAAVAFSVADPKRKYWLVLLDHGSRDELTRTPIN